MLVHYQTTSTQTHMQARMHDNPMTVIIEEMILWVVVWQYTLMNPRPAVNVSGTRNSVSQTQCDHLKCLQITPLQTDTTSHSVEITKLLTITEDEPTQAVM